MKLQYPFYIMFIGSIHKLTTIIIRRVSIWKIAHGGIHKVLQHRGYRAFIRRDLAIQCISRIILVSCSLHTVEKLIQHINKEHSIIFHNSNQIKPQICNFITNYELTQHINTSAFNYEKFKKFTFLFGSGISKDFG